MHTSLEMALEFVGLQVAHWAEKLEAASAASKKSMLAGCYFYYPLSCHDCSSEASRRRPRARKHTQRFPPRTFYKARHYPCFRTAWGGD